MTSHAASPAPLATVPAAGTGWLILLPLALLVVAQVLLGSGERMQGRFADPDAYMRLNRVLLLEDGGSWFDSRFTRINPPAGHVQHWTRPLDALLLLGAKLLEPALGFEPALHLVGVLISPLCLLLALLALDWATRPLLSRDGRLFACFLLLLQPYVLAYAQVGRPDHHSLLLLLFVLLLGAIVRCLARPEDRRPALLAGVVAALGLWVSCETLTFIGASLLALGLGWLAGDRAFAAAIRGMCTALAATLLLALLIERGDHDLLAVENDRISVLHLAMFTLIALFWQGERLLPPRLTGSWPGRLALAGAGTLAASLVMTLLFPELRAGPLGRVDPTYHDLRLRHILEIQPLVPAAWVEASAFGRIAGSLLLNVGLALVALPFLAARLCRLRSGPAAAAARPWLIVALLCAVFLPLTFYQIRWGMYAQAVLVVAYAAALAPLLEVLERRLAGARLRLIRPLVFVAALFWPLAAGVALPPPAQEIASEACPMDALAPALNALADRPQTIMALADLGPELMYRTRHHVLSIPNHRPQPGFLATAQALGSRDDATAQGLMAAHGVDWVLLCGGAPERNFFTAAGNGREDTLHARLMSDRPPDWLARVPLPGLPEVHLFERRGPWPGDRA